MDFAVEAFDVPLKLIVTARHVWGDETLGQFDCDVVANGRRVASALLTVLQGDPGSMEADRKARS